MTLRIEHDSKVALQRETHRREVVVLKGNLLIKVPESWLRFA